MVEASAPAPPSRIPRTADTARTNPGGSNNLDDDCRETPQPLSRARDMTTRWIWLVPS